MRSVTIHKNSDTPRGIEASFGKQDQPQHSLIRRCRQVVGMNVTEADVLVMAGSSRGHTVRELVGHLLGELVTPHKRAQGSEESCRRQRSPSRPENNIESRRECRKG